MAAEKHESDAEVTSSRESQNSHALGDIAQPRATADRVSDLAASRPKGAPPV
jgi:hypothetical protein